MSEQVIALDHDLVEPGFCFLRAGDCRVWLERHGSLGDWDAFAASWEGMALDQYMADGGRYRRRRHAVFTAEPGGPLRRAQHQPHYQEVDYNRLHGGIERWFEPVSEEIAGSATLGTILAACRSLFDGLAGSPAWHIELHQFRIEAGPEGAGQPTPEGRHRDGVDYVLVLMIDRHNIESGTTSVSALDGTELGSFTLTEPLDAALVNDRKVFHGVTAVTAQDPAEPAHRDVLVVTFRVA